MVPFIFFYNINIVIAAIRRSSYQGKDQFEECYAHKPRKVKKDNNESEE